MERHDIGYYFSHALVQYDNSPKEQKSYNKSSPESFGNSHVATPHSTEWTRPLCASCAMPTAKSNHLAADTLYLHHTDGHTCLSKAVGHTVP